MPIIQAIIERRGVTPYIGAVQSSARIKCYPNLGPGQSGKGLLSFISLRRTRLKKQHRRTVPFSVAITSSSVHNLDPKADDTLVDVLVGEPSDSVGVDDDDALMDADCDTEDSDTEPARFAHDH